MPTPSPDNAPGQPDTDVPAPFWDAHTAASRPAVLARQPFPERVEVLAGWLAVSGRWPSQVAADPQEVRLNRWVDHQRRRYKEGLTTAEERAALEGVPGWWWSAGRPDRSTATDRRVQELRRWLQSTDGVYPSLTVQELVERALAYWIRRRRMKNWDGTLPEDQCAVLETIPGWAWGPPGADSGGKGRREYRSFDVVCAEVVAWIRVHGGPPRNSHRADAPADERRLAHWLSHQRSKYHAGKLSPHRRRQMEILLSWDHLLDNRGRVRRLHDDR